MSRSTIPQPEPLIPSWSSTPFPTLSLSAAGLLALANLDTVAQRTRLTGGSSWLDVFVLAPGLHYQQAVDALEGKDAPLPRGGDTNPAMAQHLGRLGGSEAGSVVTLRVGVAKGSRRWSRKKKKKKSNKHKGSSLVRRIRRVCTGSSSSSRKGGGGGGGGGHRDWFSHVLYLCSPALTLTAGIFMALLQDWWGLAFLAALMVSRGLNIWSIRQRTSHAPPPDAEEEDQDEDQDEGEDDDEDEEEHDPDIVKRREHVHTIDLDNGSRIILRGSEADVRAVTTQIWLRHQNATESYLEATAKMLVYLVAAFSGNLSQAGSMVLMALLLTTAALLAVSNAHASEMQMNGRRVVRTAHDAVVDPGARQAASC
ncbi:hypothetical protein E4U43_003388 [Claviceps pusilla]|uniref:Uncharacterized protein n=1 Tax=Claviceps pusilla TaxID=123648 RepID=A0A9P7NFQ1_9HYPO|nr:hypothetical protein E4U43_003388 [Claviceps pusilla]